MSEKVPRRMRRFYRQKNEPLPSNNQEEYSLQSNGIPSMDYEDVDIDENNFNELKKIERMNLEEKLALLEVKKFKKQNKRMPNKKESEKIADNLYNQFKDGSIDDTAQGVVEEKVGRKRGRRSRSRRGNKKEEVRNSQEIPQQAPMQNTNIKDLFNDDSFDDESKSSNEDDPFNLNLDFSSNTKKNSKNELDSLSDLQEISGNKKGCNNCGEEHEKTIFCPKCGTAYCEKCAKSHDELGYDCPKCGTKTKA